MLFIENNSNKCIVSSININIDIIYSNKNISLKIKKKG